MIFSLVHLFAALHSSLVGSTIQSADSANRLLRIGIVRTFGQSSSILVSASDSARISDANGDVIDTGAGPWNLSVSSKGTVVIGTASDSSPAADSRLIRIQLEGVQRSESNDSTHWIGLSLDSPGTQDRSPFSSRHSSPRRSSNSSRFIARSSTAASSAAAGSDRRLDVPKWRYRGTLEISVEPRSGKLRIVNEIRLEDYLQGVVPMEIGAEAPREALKAQAVAARSYALKSRGRFSASGFDMTDTTACQAYGGIGLESPASNRAVRETAGLVITLSGKLVLADYYDDCGGVTAPGDSTDDYPPSVIDGPDEGGAAYCAGGASHTWQLELTEKELAQKLRGANILRKDDQLADLTVGRIDQSDRVRTLSVVGASGAAKEIRAETLRAILGYDRLKSTRFTVSRSEGGNYSFSGSGYGHGHGLCQAGAIGMAAAPYNRSFRDILFHYFPSAEIAPYGSVEPQARVSASVPGPKP